MPGHRNLAVIELVVVKSGQFIIGQLPPGEYTVMREYLDGRNVGTPQRKIPLRGIGSATEPLEIEVNVAVAIFQQIQHVLRYV